MADNALHLTETSFDAEVGKHKEVLMVDFWAEWCAPCRAIAPTLEELARDSGGKVSLAKVNVDDSLGVATRFQVQSIPTLILFRDGEIQKKIIGAKPKGALLEEISAYL